MKEHGFIMTGDMVRAFLDGRKHHTRRVMQHFVNEDPDKWRLTRFQDGFADFYDDLSLRIIRCPYAVGDLIWVRETWAHDSPHCEDIQCGNPEHIWYRASEEPHLAHCFAGSAHWRSSRFMPKWAARLWYPITAIKPPEQARDISEEDAKAEGIWSRYCEGRNWYRDYGSDSCEISSAKASFLTLWQSLYGRTDQWVWPLVLGEQVRKLLTAEQGATNV